MEPIANKPINYEYPENKSTIERFKDSAAKMPLIGKYITTKKKEYDRLLPDELFDKIFKDMFVKDLIAASSVNHQFYDISKQHLKFIKKIFKTAVVNSNINNVGNVIDFNRGFKFDNTTQNTGHITLLFNINLTSRSLSISTKNHKSTEEIINNIDKKCQFAISVGPEKPTIHSSADISERHTDLATLLLPIVQNSLTKTLQTLSNLHNGFKF
jgi:hypothetical protein